MKLTMFAYKDSDKDKVPNIFDCQPYNPKMQDVKPNVIMKQRIEKLPIYVTKSSLKGKSHYEWHISDKDAPKEPKQRVYSLIKKYPQIVGEIERKSQTILHLQVILEIKLHLDIL